MDLSNYGQEIHLYKAFILVTFKGRHLIKTSRVLLEVSSWKHHG